MKPKMTAEELQKLIDEKGSPYRAALSLGISPQAFYERMDRAGLERNRDYLLPGEPTSKKDKKVWLSELLDGNTVIGVAEKMHCSVGAIQRRMKLCGLRRSPDVTPNRVRPKDLRGPWLQRQLKKHGNGRRVALALGISPQAVYERMKRYGIE
jgi:DNA-binding NtrC family response regulator